MIKLTDLWLHTERQEIRADFDNDRHHAVRINGPLTPDKLVEALLTLAHQIAGDPHLAKQETLKTGYVVRVDRPGIWVVHSGADCPLVRNGGPLQLVDVSTLGSWRRCRYCFG